MKCPIALAALLAMGTTGSFADSNDARDVRREALANEIVEHVARVTAFANALRARACDAAPDASKVRAGTWTEVWPATSADVYSGGRLTTNTVSGEVWSDAIEDALARKGAVHLAARAKPYYIDRPIELASGQAFVADADAEIRLVPGTATCLLRNRSVVGMDQRTLTPVAVPYDRGILVSGGRWHGLKTSAKSLNGNTRGVCSKTRPVHGCYGAFVFNHVDGIVVENTTVGGCNMHAYQFSDVRNFLVKDARLQAPARDGVHLHGNCFWGRIDGVAGETWDDMVALNAWDWANTSPMVGPIHHVLVENVVGDWEQSRAEGRREGTSTIRLLPGNRRRKDASGTTCACPVREVVLRKLVNIRNIKAYDQPNLEMGRDKDRSEPIGLFANVFIEDLRLDRRCQIELDDMVDGFDVSNVRYSYSPPQGETLVRIGPMSATYKCGPDPSKWVEIFSPDEDITVKDFSLRNVQHVEDGIARQLNAVNFLVVKDGSLNPDYPKTTPRGGTGRVTLLP